MTAQVASRPNFFVDRETPTRVFLVESATERVFGEIPETLLRVLADTAPGWFSAVPDDSPMFTFATAGRLVEGPTHIAAQRAANDLPIESALRTADIEHASARLKELGQLRDDWDGEGALAPNPDAIGGAIAFLNRLQPWHPRPIAGLDSEGNPVIEFHDDDTSLFGKVRFIASDTVEMFYAYGNLTTEFLEGPLHSEPVLKFLSDQLQITLLP
jgi:hypothetical protein